jgi:hypothetical protein
MPVFIVGPNQDYRLSDFVLRISILPLSKVQGTRGLFFVVFWGLMWAELMGAGIH